MKKMIYFIVLAVLCLSFSIHAQENKAVDVTASGIQIGQKVPDVILNNIHNYKTKTAKLSDFKGKLLILDFCATWCGACISMVPKMDSLQKTLSDKVQFISVFYEPEKTVIPFFEKLENLNSSQYDVPLITDDKQLHKLFPHKYLPHYVWVDANGTVIAITGLESVNADNIQSLYKGKVVLARKQDMNLDYNNDIPLLVNGNGGDGKNLIYHSVLAGYKEGLAGMFNVIKTDNVHVDRITFTNATVLWLYKHAYGNGNITFFKNNKIVFEVKYPEELTSKLIGPAYIDWLSKPGRGVCYELKVPQHLTNQFYPLMRQELVKLFPQYAASVEKRKIKSMALVRLPGVDKIHTKDLKSNSIEQFDQSGFTLQNTKLDAIIDRMQMVYQQRSAIPFVDQTNYTGMVDIVIQANLGNVSSMNLALRKYNLQWQEKLVEQEVLVIKDKQQISEKIKSL